jgi:hypothetical protein
LFFYRHVPGRNLREIYQLDIQTRDEDEATTEPYRSIDMEKVARSLTMIGFSAPRDADDAFCFDPEGDAPERSKVDLVIERGLLEGTTASVWACHVSLHVPMGDQNGVRDKEIESLLRRVCLACHDHGLMGYDPGHDRELTPATLHVLAEEISQGDESMKPWWKMKLW